MNIPIGIPSNYIASVNIPIVIPSNYITSVNISIGMLSNYIASVNIPIGMPFNYIASVIFNRLVYFLIFRKAHCLLVILAVSLLYFQNTVKNFLNRL